MYETLGLRGPCSMYIGSFSDLRYVKGICGYLVHFSEKKGRNSKKAHRRAKHMKFGPHGCI